MHGVKRKFPKSVLCTCVSMVWRVTARQKFYSYKTEALQVGPQSNSNFYGSAWCCTTYRTGLDHLISEAIEWIYQSISQSVSVMRRFSSKTQELFLLSLHSLHVLSFGLPLLTPFSWAMKIATTKANQETTRARHAG